MKASGDEYELDDDDEDYEELAELEEVRNEQVRIWLDNSFSGKELTLSCLIVGNKHNTDMMADIQGDLSF